jgi:hypothetical protein
LGFAPDFGHALLTKHVQNHVKQLVSDENRQIIQTSSNLRAFCASIVNGDVRPKWNCFDDLPFGIEPMNGAANVRERDRA